MRSLFVIRHKHGRYMGTGQDNYVKLDTARIFSRRSDAQNSLNKRHNSPDLAVEELRGYTLNTFVAIRLADVVPV